MYIGLALGHDLPTWATDAC